MLKPKYAAVMCVMLAALSSSAAEQGVVKESAREIPVAYTVDVIVIGGSTGAVAAAKSAADQGASVFLAAPRPYLGEDMCASLRLWLEPGEQPTTALAKAIFTDTGGAHPISARIPANALKFQYEADRAPAARHGDTKVPSKLATGVVGPPEKDSVQYDGDVTLTADLGAAAGVAEARLVLYDKKGSDFTPGPVTVSVSSDKKEWKAIDTYQPGEPGGDQVVTIAAPIATETRYIRYQVKKGAESKRVLIGQIVIVSDKAEPAKPAAAVAGGGIAPPRPLHVKKTLDDALLAAKVQYLFGCYATELLHDSQGHVCGIVMANRAGRQAVLGKVIIDASDRAIVARMAGAKFTPYAHGEQTFFTTIIGGEIKNAPGISSRVMARGFGDPKHRGDADDNSFELVQYSMPISMPDDSWASFASAEQSARDRTWGDKGEINTDDLFQVPPDAIKGMAGASANWKAAADLDLRAMQPAGVDRLYVLGGCADVTRDAAASLLRPCAFMELGERIGAAAANDAKKIDATPVQQAVVSPVIGAGSAAIDGGEVKELLGNVHPTMKAGAMVQSPDRALPILGQYDVVVVGGGTGGAPAAISAARAHSKTLCIEYLHALGGVGTNGLVTKYYWGYRGGFTAEVPGDKNGWDPWEKAEWLRKEIRTPGGDIWFGVLGCGAYVQDGIVRGVVVATPTGRGVVLAKVVIDSTGNSDVAAAAGAQTMQTGAQEELAMQGTGLPSMKLGASYNNTDFTLVDETDMRDVWHVLVYAKNKYVNAFDMGQLIDTRERRRIVGDFTMTLPDQINARTYPDTISISYSNFDTHGYTVDPYLLIEHPEKKGVTVNIPYRCLLPRGLDRILVTGLGISVHRDAVPLTRMQPDIQNQGYAAGLIASVCARENLATRSVDLRPIQQELVKKQIIPEHCLTDRDSYPLPAERIAEAVKKAAKGDGMAVIVTHPTESIPLLRKAFEEAATPETKLSYAKILAVLGDATGLDTIITAIDAMSWDKGWNYHSMGQFGGSLSPLDTLIVAAGRTHDKRALPAILRKVKDLDDAKEFSHHRAVALACESIGDPSAAAVLAELLKKPGMTGYVTTSVETAGKLSGTSATDLSTRSTSLRELSLARALFRCGDVDGLGRKILEQYSQDLRGHLARHAQAVLDEKKENK